MEIEITALWIKGNTAIVGSLILWGGIRHTYPLITLTAGQRTDLHRGRPDAREQTDQNSPSY